MDWTSPTSEEGLGDEEEWQESDDEFQPLEVEEEEDDEDEDEDEDQGDEEDDEEDEDLLPEEEDEHSLAEEEQGKDGGMVVGYTPDKLNYLEEFLGNEGLPKASPTFELVNIDRKLPIKLRRHEFEPIPNGVFGNISQCTTEPSKYTLKEFESKTEALTDRELDLFLPYLLQNGEDSTDLYVQLRSQLIDKYDKDPATYISLEYLRVISPDTPIHFLASALELMTTLKDINTSHLSKDGANDFFSAIKNGPIKNGKYECFTCTKDCSRRRYSHREHFFIICTECFELGKFPFEFASVDFVSIGNLNPYDDKRTNEDISLKDWSLAARLKLLTSIEEVGMDWQKVSILVGKPPEECEMMFLVSPSPFDTSTNISSQDVLKELIGTPLNPLVSLISLLSSAVHPGLGSEAAKAGLAAMNNCNPSNSESLWNSAVLALEASLKRASSIAQLEETVSSTAVEELLELQAILLDKKMTLLKLFSSANQ